MKGAQNEKNTDSYADARRTDDFRLLRRGNSRAAFQILENLLTFSDIGSIIY